MWSSNPVRASNILLLLVIASEFSAGDTPKVEFQYEIRLNSKKHLEVKLIAAPSYVLALTHKPPHKEEMLKSHSWLVMGVNGRSRNDQLVAQEAFRTVKEFNRTSKTQLKLGIRPFWEFSEFKAWVPECHPLEITPVWIILRNNKVVAFRTGAFPGIDDATRLRNARSWLKSHLEAKTAN